jgi:hypothetical protein
VSYGAVSLTFPTISTQLYSSLLLHSAQCLFIAFPILRVFHIAAIFRIATSSHSENGLYYAVISQFKDSNIDVNATLIKFLSEEHQRGIPLYNVCHVSTFCTSMCGRSIKKVFLIMDYPFNVAAVELGEALQCHQQ